jgi:hypothetical protein
MSPRKAPAKPWRVVEEAAAVLYLIHTFYYVKMVDQYCFLANLLNLTCSICSIMAGVLGRLVRPQNEGRVSCPMAMELETAKEILAEVFRVRLSEVDEMIQNRFEKPLLACCL